MNSVQQELLELAVGHHKAGRLAEAEELYNRLLNGLPQEENVLLFLSDIYLRKDYNALAAHLLSFVLRMHPSCSQAWCSLGVAHRKENHPDLAEACWQKALSIAGDTVEVCNNMAGLYADMAEPQKALPWIERAGKVAPNDHTVKWHKALALLSLGDYEEGWKLYEARRQKEGWHPRDSVKCPMWDGSYVGHLYIHGEQGVGDEVMFSSAIPHVIGRAGRITLEVNEKVASLARETWPDFTVVTDETPGDYDAKIPIGSLLGMFGHNRQPFLKPDPRRVAFYRGELEKLGPGPYVALTWLGGNKVTRALNRSISIAEMQPILKRFTCVSAQYSHPQTYPYVEEDRKRVGLPKINDAACGDDLHEQAALFKAVDAVVTVQQTAVHVAGGVGAKTFALIGDKPHWRYRVEGDEMAFYNSVRLFRKKTDWPEAIERVCDALERELSRTEPATA